MYVFSQISSDFSMKGSFSWFLCTCGKLLWSFNIYETLRCFRLILHFPYSRPKINWFFIGTWFFYGRMIFRNQDLSTWGACCYLEGLSTDRTRDTMMYDNSYVTQLLVLVASYKHIIISVSMHLQMCVFMCVWYETETAIATCDI